MEIKRYAAIDIGSNAVRLLINTVIKAENKEPQFKKSAFVRVPIRLGTDVFTTRLISEENTDRLLEAMRAFDMLMQVHYVDEYRACATSAMREADNGREVVDKVKRETGITIEIIDGADEAATIASADIHEFVKNDKNYLYVDVGGGSTEFTVFSNGKPVVSKSFQLGTVRLLNKMVHAGLWGEAEAWVKKHTERLKPVKMIGSGGNINHIYKYSGKKKTKPITFLYLSSYYQMLTALTYEERVSQLEMKLDRADVIVPATKIYLSAMKWSGAQKIYVPKIGLTDGIIKMLYNQDTPSFS